MLQSVLKTQISSQSQIDMDPKLYDTAANGNSKTPLYIAAANGSVEIVTKILQNCPSPTRESLDGKTALHAAVYTYPTGSLKRPHTHTYTYSYYQVRTFARNFMDIKNRKKK